MSKDKINIQAYFCIILQIYFPQCTTLTIVTPSPSQGTCVELLNKTLYCHSVSVPVTPSPSQGNCVVLLNKTLYCHSVSVPVTPSPSQGNCVVLLNKALYCHSVSVSVTPSPSITLARTWSDRN